MLIKMAKNLEDLIAGALYQTSAIELPSECVRFGLATGDSSEAFSGKIAYVKKRLNGLSEAKQIKIAKQVVQEHPSDKLQSAIERWEDPSGLVSDVTRQKLAEALNGFCLSGKLSLKEMLQEHWPEIRLGFMLDDLFGSEGIPFLSNDSVSSALNLDQENYRILKSVGFLDCSQLKLFRFLEDIVAPVRREKDEQEEIINKLNPILERDSYHLVHDADVSGHPLFHVSRLDSFDSHPDEESISSSLIEFDQSGIHDSWRKALERKELDPAGAITAARSLLEGVCKQIIEDSGGSYQERDDLPRLYRTMAKSLRLAPAQHSHQVIKQILGSCQGVVGGLATIRNMLGDAHGQGKRRVKPRPRHAQLAVNLAGTMAIFLISTWNDRQDKNRSN